MFFFRDAIVATLWNSSRPFTVREISFEVKVVENVTGTVTILEPDGTELVSKTVRHYGLQMYLLNPTWG